MQNCAREVEGLHKKGPVQGELMWVRVSERVIN